ncbi:carbon monoxide dehydrogenase [Nocardioides sp. Root1257]|uniref:SRPBCC family protein n=1 Tax=unclassified Nocardioides TaxID=2615069 RepID=UPI0006FBC521|nr:MULTISPECIES: SRPBCC family protein [unclassified Nocardioides]KQW48666.1 carbon monoxide dehydrogenase [Nocardioides sp. Root1257]KRC47841.1 carbon monoxide dehydrogenase [Nocardioides sp. Root224]
MDLTHRFTVPTSVDETWAHFQDIASVAECFPGATVTEADGDSFAGSVKVKLGPIALVYNGAGTFVEKDEAAHRFLVDAKGRDKRGNGTAGAKVTLTMTDAASGGTDVEVVTDLAITGKPAQFGRGVMQDVSDKLLGQFVECLEQRLSAGSTGASQETTPASEQATGAEPETASVATPPPTVGVVPDVSAPAEAPDGPKRQGLPQQPRQDDALDLGSAVLPVLAKTYWKPVVGVVVVVGVVIWWVSRR